MYWVVILYTISHFRIVINNRDIGILKDFGTHLRKLRMEKRISQQNLELQAGISKNQIGNIERGEVNITLITATAISKALDISVKELFNY
jgi:transcriptional regulator with XRE-family HTH domain